MKSISIILLMIGTSVLGVWSESWVWVAISLTATYQVFQIIDIVRVKAKNAKVEATENVDASTEIPTQKNEFKKKAISA